MSLFSPLPTPVDDVLSLIGRTPLVKVRNIDTGPCELFLKLESHNPGGSIKDRVGLSMINVAEKSGKLGDNRRHIVEATAGNTGLGLALVAARRGYKLTLVIPDKMSREKVFHLRALGATVVTTRSDVAKGHPDHYQELAARIAQEENAFFVNQFENPANPLAHQLTTGPEILAQLDHDLDAMVCGVGSGGTITGLSRYFARELPKCEIVLADPVGSILAGYVSTGEIGKAGSWLVEGIGEDFIPPICDLSRVKTAYSITDRESVETTRQLLKDEGVLAGSSSGTLVAAALRYCRAQSSPKRVCTLVCDSGNKYLSKAFNDAWLVDEGFSDRRTTGDLRDVISRRHADKAVVTVSPDDSLRIAYVRMKQHDVSQLPVVDRGKIVGLIDESDLLLVALDNPLYLQLSAREVMSTRLRTVGARASVRELLPLFDEGLVPIVMDGDEFLGLITKIDLLNYLRRGSPTALSRGVN